MFRFPLSLGRVPTPLAPVAPLAAGLGLVPACWPTHEARTGTAAVAAAPLRSVRLSMTLPVRSLDTSTSRCLLANLYPKTARRGTAFARFARETHQAAEQVRRASGSSTRYGRRPLSS